MIVTAAIYLAAAAAYYALLIKSAHRVNTPVLLQVRTADETLSKAA